ncbi:FecCD family ABC transporter permease [Chondromyces apiculatus]|uniref:Hemin ABC transporter permease protein n=1 Tax=Chondromyces apiculatus DSM 436 TaxID=1192034 RepID=A0A017SXJ3_9BACT|nr:iron ABC transporter permease [Chondromyces apiculatus]EYF01673.1 hemin ABC transporter permease protein [Chondromyces apiculatus DSM 436]
MTSAAFSALAHAARRPAGRRTILLTLAALLAFVTLLAASIGAVPLSLAQVLAIALRPLGLVLPVHVTSQDVAVFWAIRLPRIVLGILVGACLGASGAAMQGLLRNPLADPGLIGISSGASFGAALAILLVGAVGTGVPLIPVAAFAGGLLAAFAAFRIGREDGHPGSLLLAGIAINALAFAGVGLVIDAANDAQLRTITFWTLGSLGGASWDTLRWTAPPLIVSVFLLQRLARPLNLLLLGDIEARHLGVRVDRVQRNVIALAAFGVGAAVSVAGLISFVGLIAPHLVRLVVGPDHRAVLPGSALVGAIVLLLADLLARTAIAPRELAIGILTALLGAPFLLALLWGGARAGRV